MFFADRIEVGPDLPATVLKMLRVCAPALAIAALAWPALSSANTSASSTGQIHGWTLPVSDSHSGSGATPSAAAISLARGDASDGGSVSASASARIGTLHLIAAASGYANGPSYLASANDPAYARASWDDLLRIDAGSALAGKQGALTAQLSYAGLGGGILDAEGYNSSAEWFNEVTILATGAPTISNPYAPYGCGGWSFCFYDDNTRSRQHGSAGDYVNHQYTDGTIPQRITLSIPIVFGGQTTLDYTVDLTTAGYASAYGGTASGGANYNSTLSWGGITGVFDASGARVKSFSVTSASGFDYLQASPVPEPATGWLWLAGAALIVYRLRRGTPGSAPREA